MTEDTNQYHSDRTGKVPAKNGTDEKAIHTEKAWAKINLGLCVLGRRDDGFHEIRTIMQTVDLGDTLRFYPAPGPTMSCSDPGLSTGEENLVMRAMRLFGTRVNASIDFHVHLDKLIPRGAGLGGGSADAAATLRGLNAVTGVRLAQDELLELAAQLGSDVPFLINGGSALVRGRGEIVETIEFQSADLHYVVVYPEVEISTAWAYGQLRPPLTTSSAYRRFLDSVSGGRVDWRKLLEVAENDFQPLVERANPIVAEVADLIRQAGARVCSMSGTGSAVYGIFDDRNAASQACDRLKAKKFRSFFCRPVL